MSHRLPGLARDDRDVVSNRCRPGLIRRFVHAASGELYRRQGRDDAVMDVAVVGGLFALGGVVLGAGLNELSARRGRRELINEQREQARHDRELAATELLDEALVRSSLALDRDVGAEAVSTRYSEAHDAWQEGWVAHSPRIRQAELLDRVQAVGTMLHEATMRGGDESAVPRYLLARAIANARSALAHFMRGDPLPPTAFPAPDELIRLLGEGDGTEEPLGPLRAWLTDHPPPEFHLRQVEPAPEHPRLRP